MSKETLEEAAENKYGLSNQYSKNRIGFIAGAKWQADRMYSEEDMKKYAIYMLRHTKYITPKEWFEQFKKKQDE